MIRIVGLCAIALVLAAPVAHAGDDRPAGWDPKWTHEGWNKYCTEDADIHRDWTIVRDRGVPKSEVLDWVRQAWIKTGGERPALSASTLAHEEAFLELIYKEPQVTPEDVYATALNVCLEQWFKAGGK